MRRLRFSLKSNEIDNPRLDISALQEKLECVSLYRVVFLRLIHFNLGNCRPENHPS